MGLLVWVDGGLDEKLASHDSAAAGRGTARGLETSWRSATNGFAVTQGGAAVGIVLVVGRHIVSNECESFRLWVVFLT